MAERTVGLATGGCFWHDGRMQNWNRPDPLTRNLIHLINTRRHDHWDADAAFDTLAELIEQNREDEILTVLAALDEDMAERMVHLPAEAAPPPPPPPRPRPAPPPQLPTLP